MTKANSLLLRGVLLLASPVYLCAQMSPLLDGYVTRIGTPQEFDVSGVHVSCSPGTMKRVSEMQSVADGCAPRVYGERLAIFGRRDKKTDTIVATQIDQIDTQIGETVSGFAVVDKVFSPTLLRVDGYALQINPATKSTWHLPLVRNSEPEVHQWVQYEGKRDANGVLQATELVFFASAVTSREQKLRDKGEFNPTAVSEKDRQSRTSKFFLGANNKKIPAVHDTEQQARVDTIANRLIPESQKELPLSDPRKFDVRFQLVDSKAKDCIGFANGIILVPMGVAKALTDDELAAILADAIGRTLEKQSYRYLPRSVVRNAASVASTVGGLLIPGLGFASDAGSSFVDSKISKRLSEQTGRMSLVLMHDGGFDLKQAPIAWWRLSTKKPDFMKKPAPYRSTYLFQALATTWQPTSPLSKH
jgi:hypothetical protein